MTKPSSRETIKEREWEHAGLKCVVLFIINSHRCGYVRVPKDNPAFKLNYNDVPVIVHGGLTFGDKTLDDMAEEGYYWFGFDCAHAGDMIQGMLCFDSKEHFWTTEDVEMETNKLAEQLSKITWKEIVLYKLEYMPEWFKKRVKVSI